MTDLTSVQTDQAPAPVGPYSQAVKADDLVFISGQIALHPKTGELVMESLEAETAQVLDNLLAVLAASGSSIEQVIKTTVYLADMNDFNAVNAIYSKYFKTHLPARVCVEVSRLPKDVRVEIDAIARVS